jgi:serine phosphatase RsbU (regulator of sigma subunit)
MPSLHILKGASEGALIPLDGDKFVLGRNPDCCIVIPVTSVNREHAQILRVQGRYYIEDKQSRNGTFVNNQAITTRTPLKNNDRIRICDFLAAFLDNDDEQDPRTQDLISALGGDPGDGGPKRVQVLSGLGASLQDECRRIRQSLELNHVFYAGTGVSELQDELSRPGAPARQALAEGFYQLVVFDADRGIDADGVFDLEQFLRHVYDQMVRDFDLRLTDDTYHLENIVQILKDEPRSLLCFLNVQRIPIIDLRRLRGFAQERHQAFFICCGVRDLAKEEQGSFDETSDIGLATQGESPGSSLLDAQSAEKLRLLLEISGNLSKTLELDALLPKIVDSLFQMFRQADRCFLIQTEEGTNRLLPRVVRTRRPQDETTARFSSRIVRRCLESAQAFLTNDAPKDDRIQLSQSVVDFRIRSVMCVPLCRGDGTAFGVIQLDTQDLGKKFTPEDLKLLWGVANQASIALENARLHEDEVQQERLRRDLELAHQVQLSFLPRKLPKVAGYDFYAHYESALEVGGDYYDFIPLPQGRLAVALCDVAGKGMAAAILMARVVAEVRLSLLSEPEIGRAVGKLNDLLYEFTSEADRFVTLAVAVLDPARHTATLVDAGRLSPLLFRQATGQFQEAVPPEKSGVPLGIMQGFQFEPCQVALSPGDLLLMFTDGVTNSVNVQNKALGARGLEEALKGVAPSAPRAVVEQVMRTVKQHAVGRLPIDDVTLVALSRAPG